MTILDLNPQLVWKNFHILTQLPRPSKGERQAADAIAAFGRNLGLETIQDEVGNVIIRKPATPGFEDRKGVILQGHIDMVPQADKGIEHDWSKDPIETIVEGDWVRANGTTLGADNGIGVAMAMTVLEDNTLKHGPIEVLVTIDEETGMTGARALKAGLLQGSILINCDSEEDGQMAIGCAGGLNAKTTFEFETEKLPEGYATYEVTVGGGHGGHSGTEIHLGFANAIKELARLLIGLFEYDIKLVSLTGGTVRNSIPREATAVVCLPKEAEAAVKASVEAFEAVVKNEYKDTDPDLFVSIAETKQVRACMADEYTDTILLAVYSAPNGVQRMSPTVKGVTETSVNLGVIATEGNKVIITSLLRSSVDSAKEALATKLESVYALACGEVEFEGGYSGWLPNMDSEIKNLFIERSKALWGREMIVSATHGGLECGILGGTYPAWDMISVGPEISGPHTPSEKVQISSVERFWNLLVDILEHIPAK